MNIQPKDKDVPLHATQINNVLDLVMNKINFEETQQNAKPRKGIIKAKEAIAIRRKFSLVGIITKALFSNSPNDFKIRLFG